MPGMGKHTKEEVMKTRARVSAWSVFIGMAGTTMAFQVYHSVKYGHMPSTLAYLYGIVPLAISMLVIEFVSGWENAPKWARPSAYLITGGSMFLSAAATGAVVFHAAPDHASLLFGLLLDGAAILAARFLMTAGQKAVDAAGQAEVGTADAVALRAALEGERLDRQAAEAERDTARQAAAAAGAEAEALPERWRRKRSEVAVTGHGSPGDAEGDCRARGGRTWRRSFDTYAAALEILDKDPDITASELGRRLNRSEGRGRQIKRELTKTAPQGLDGGA